MGRGGGGRLVPRSRCRSTSGRDFYEVLSTPHGTRAILGDVQGKGLPAVSTAGAVVGAFRKAGYHEPGLDVFASRMESGLSRHKFLKSALGDHEERFATAVAISFATDFGSVEVVNFGHEGPFVIGPHGVRQLPQEQGSPVGMAELTGSPQSSATSPTPGRRPSCSSPMA
ncbi:MULTISPECIES: PP2C family protein-serine/threonine phosphatase [unclassified Streptomyces]|uniref:PP2C family protein-serine/threonine phosphatase n=1 Tax=unclassified Streptomyces TaxID=2593676 RepID=UPI0027E4D778|nr:PP2C family protein-serine/threonine phosphatase [Streptomyces sp. SM10]